MPLESIDRENPEARNPFLFTIVVIKAFTFIVEYTELADCVVSSVLNTQY